METVKPVIKWLEELSEPYRSEALANCANPDFQAHSIYDALYAAFYWEKTTQGSKYWQLLYDRLKYNAK